MTVDPRASLAALVAALERHFEAASSRQDPDDPTVVAAAQDLADAFEDYDEALFRATEVATPLALYDEDDEFDDDEEDVEDDELEDEDDELEDEDDELGDEDEDEDDELEDEFDDHEDEDRGSGVYAGLDEDDIEFEDDTVDGDSARDATAKDEAARTQAAKGDAAEEGGDPARGRGIRP